MAESANCSFCFFNSFVKSLTALACSLAVSLLFFNHDTNATIPAIKAATTATTAPTGFAAIAAFHRYCANVIAF